MLEIEKFGLVEMSLEEAQQFDGGNLWKKLGWSYIVTSVIDNWEDIKAGWKEGYAAGYH